MPGHRQSEDTQRRGRRTDEELGCASLAVRLLEVRPDDVGRSRRHLKLGAGDALMPKRASDGVGKGDLGEAGEAVVERPLAVDALASGFDGGLESLDLGRPVVDGVVLGTAHAEEATGAECRTLSRERLVRAFQVGRQDLLELLDGLFVLLLLVCQRCATNSLITRTMSSGRVPT